MIQITRGAKSEPAVLRGQLAKQAREHAARFFNSRSKAAHQSEHEFDQALLESTGVREALRDTFGERCAFCGRGAQSDNELVTHHFRPAEGAVAEDGEISRRHYWWLAYAWENLYLACSECQTAQGRKFPVGNARARAGSGPEALMKESAELLDPCAENVEALLVYLDTGELVAGDRRAKTTIDTLELNRPRLVRDRAHAMDEITWEILQLADRLGAQDFDSFFAQLSDLYDRDKPLAALRRQRVNQWAQFRPRKIEAAFRVALGTPQRFEELAAGLRRVTNHVKRQEAFAFYGEAAEFYLRPERFSIQEARPRTQYRRIESQPMDSLPPMVEKPAPKPWSYLDSAEIRAVEIRTSARSSIFRST